jgi:two-component system, OmpR family, alkaline phosphatase synthesis response regulator PhoP
MSTHPTSAPSSLPASDSATHPAGESVETDLRGSLVLLVDDNEQNLELLTAYVEELGCRLALARDGVEAMEMVTKEPPDLILLDVMMPRMSGFQVCTKLKGTPAYRDIPIVMVTALNEVNDVERAVDSGADDFLTKPVNKLELLTRVRSLLRVRHLKHRLDRTLDELRRVRGA